MTGQERLDAIEEIKQLKGRYFLHVDLKEWDHWRGVFAEDAVMDLRAEFPEAPDPQALVLIGADKIVETVSGLVPGVTTAHHGHTPLIELLNDTEASGIWSLEDNLWYPSGLHLHGFGHYREVYRKVAGRWVIARCTISRMKMIRNQA